MKDIQLLGLALQLFGIAISARPPLLPDWRIWSVLGGQVSGFGFALVVMGAA